MASSSLAGDLVLLLPPECENHPEEFRFLSDNFNVLLPSDFETADEVTRRQVTGIVCECYHGARGFMTPEFLDQVPNVRVVCGIGTGYDHLNARVLLARGIKVGHGGNTTAEPTAELAVALILASARRLTQGLKYMYTDDNLPGFQVKGKTLGIIGMGEVGYRVAKKLKGFEMPVVYHNRHRRSRDEENAVGALYYANKDDVIKAADFLLIAVRRTPGTIGMIGQREFRLMKPTSVLVNVARGDIVQTDALVQALESKTIMAAALDVTDPEPLPDSHPLRHMENVMVTPHQGSNTVEALREIERLCIDNLKAGMRGENLIKHIPLT